MDRVTRADLDEQAKTISELLGSDFYVQEQHEGARLLVQNGKGHDEVSPRSGRKQLYVWANAFIAGIEAGIDRAGKE
jgi:hypothetical protein